MKKIDTRGGYTLLEVVIYIALFSFVVGGMILTAYGIIEHSGRLEDKVVVDEDGDFLIRKIDWALTNAAAVSCPVPGELQITKLGLPAGDNPLLFSLTSHNITLKRGGAAPLQLNSSAVSAPSLIFTCASASGKKPASVRTELTLLSQSASETFDVTKYLRQ